MCIESSIFTPQALKTVQVWFLPMVYPWLGRWVVQVGLAGRWPARKILSEPYLRKKISYLVGTLVGV